MLDLPDLRLESFSLVFAAAGGIPSVKLSGNGDAEVVSPLDRTLTALHERLVDAQATSVIVDLCDLYFMNSSCLKAFVAWIYKVRTAGNVYRIRLQLNPRQRWQRRGLEPLQRLAPAVVFLDEINQDSTIPGAAGGEVNEQRNVSLFLRLAFCPSHSLVSAISRLVSDFCRQGLCDLDISSRFHMAAHELAENMTKYSSSSAVSLEIELSEHAGEHLLTLRTKNHASRERLLEVERRLVQLRETTDPAQLYDQLIEQTAPLQGVSGLGLARIRAEGLDFNYEIHGDELTLIVQEPVSRPSFCEPG